MLACAGAVPAGNPGIAGTFIQLNRSVATNSVDTWKADLAKMRAVGINTLIVQWSVEKPVAYFRTNSLPCAEQYDTIKRLFEAVHGSGMTVYLGLENDPDYWTQIKSRDRVLRDYFLLRVAANEQVQKGLLAAFELMPEWVGYYIPDEVDDLSWRHPSKQGFIQGYLSLMTRRLKANDPKRAVAVSAFFRGRTAPDIFGRNLVDLTTRTDPHVDIVLVQDGVGVGDPPDRYVPTYLKTLREMWPPKGPQFWVVVEAFRQTSSANAPFAAEPASPERLAGQIESAGACADRSILFTFNDYAHPGRGAAAAALYKSLLDRAGGVRPSLRQ